MSVYSTNGNVDIFGIIGIPERTLMLLVLIIGLLGLIGMKIRRNQASSAWPKYTPNG